jgi:ribosome-associated protein
VLQVSHAIAIPDDEVQISAVRAQGAGGQNVNKVASAVHLRFDIAASKSLPDSCKQRLLRLRDHRVTSNGVIVIKSQQHRSQEQNKAEALERLRELIQSVLVTRKPRKATKPTRASQAKRLERKTRHGRLKQSRGKPED